MTGVIFPEGPGKEFFFTTMSRLVMRSPKPPIQWVLGTLSLGVQQTGHEAEHSHASSTKVKNAWSYTSSP